MELSSIIEQATRAHAAPSEGTREAAVSGLDALRQLRAWCDAIEVALGRVLAECATYPQAAIGEPLRLDDRHGETVLRRAATLDEVPVYGDALSAGRVSGAHVDVVGAALRKIEPHHRDALAHAAGRLIGVAENDTADALRRKLAAETRKLRADDGTTVLERQRRDTRLRTWVDNNSGMYHVAGRFDPETGVIINAALRSVVDTLYSEQIPDHAPTDPTERQDFLRAHAFVHLITCGGGPITIDIVPVIDLTTPVAEHGALDIDWGIPVELPDSVIGQWWNTATVNPVVLASGAVIHAPGVLDLHRTSRLASKAQRRALRARHRTCAIPGCTVAYDNCWIHHITWWEHGGNTNLDNLIPVCTRHHTQIHNRTIHIELTPTRHVTITRRANAPPGSAAA